MYLSYIFSILLLIVGIFLIIIILLQRGRGGGLAGAFGGLGGQSAFGTKAGDVFTKITIVLAVIWVALAGVSGLALEHDAHRREQGLSGSEEGMSAGPSDKSEPGPSDAANKDAASPLDKDLKTSAEEPKAGDAVPEKTTKTPETDAAKSTPPADSNADKPAEKPAEETKPAAENKAAEETKPADGAAAETKPAEPADAEPAK